MPRIGGRKYQAAALGVQQEVEDIRQELLKLLRTINSTNAGIVGAENELLKKVRCRRGPGLMRCPLVRPRSLE